MKAQEISFILNNKTVSFNGPNTKPLVDFIRDDQGLKATKTGCREGDCGACTLIVGKLVDNQIVYQAVTSCIFPVGNAHGRHVITLESLTPADRLNPVQEAFVATQATQCGFCTPGFVMSVCAAVLSCKELNEQVLLQSIDGNLCRCTGYHSIIRAIQLLVKTWTSGGRSLEALKRLLFPFDSTHLVDRLKEIPALKPEIGGATIMGGGTDFMVQEGYPHSGHNLVDRLPFSSRPEMKMIAVEPGGYRLGAAVTATELFEAPFVKDDLPDLFRFFPRISSTQIRNEATLGGNLVNASPIADFAMVLLALDASLEIKNEQGVSRTKKLDSFFLDYKKLDLRAGEWIEAIWIPKPLGKMNFEKVSKREMLDIASVNSGAQVWVEGGRIQKAIISAGGVAPIPLVLRQVADYLPGKELNKGSILKATEIAAREISPISDIRGSSEYKTLLLKNLILAHFHCMFPKELTGVELWSK